MELNQFTQSSRRTIEKIKATIDSGAAVHVLPTDAIQAYPLMPSKASVAGVKYKAANGERVPDLGQKIVDVKMPGGATGRMTVCVAGVHKLLLSVAKIVGARCISRRIGAA